MTAGPARRGTDPSSAQDGWADSTLGRHLSFPIRNGYSPLCPVNPTGTWTLSLAAVTEAGFRPEGAKPAPGDDPKVLDYLLSPGDIVVSRSNTPDRVGLAGVYRGEPARCAYPDLMMRVRTAPSLDVDYLLLHLLSGRGRNYFAEHARGSSSSMVKIGRATLESFPLPLPAPEEQRAIAAVLGDVDELLVSLEMLVAKKRDLRQAAIQQLLTGRRRLPGFGNGSGGTKTTEVGPIPADWVVAPVASLANVTTGSKNTQDRVEDGRYPFFVRSATVERINSFSFDGEAVLTAGDGVGTGKVFHYINGKFDCHQRVYRISNFSPSLSGYFFFLFFRARFYDRIMSMTAKSSVDSVRMEMIADMLVPLPSIEEQVAIAEVVSDMDAELLAAEQRLGKTKMLRQGVAQQLLSGKTRLARTEMEPR